VNRGLHHGDASTMHPGMAGNMNKRSPLSAAALRAGAAPPRSGLQPPRCDNLPPVQERSRTVRAGGTA
jgi:hypothetical protein